MITASEGFNFLGFNVRHYKCKRNKQEHNLLIKPSDESVSKMRRKLKEEWRKLNGSNIDAVITRLNPIIRGWANYFKTQVSSKTFRKFRQLDVHQTSQILETVTS